MCGMKNLEEYSCMGFFNCIRCLHMVVYCFISCIKAYLSAVFFKHKYNILEHPRGGKCLPRPPKINPVCSRLEPIMLLKLPIMLLSSAPKSSLLCSKLCSEIQIGTVKFNTLKLYST